MAQYLIVHDEAAVTTVEATTIKNAAEKALHDNGANALIYRVADGPKRVTMTVQEIRSVEISDAGQDQ